MNTTELKEKLNKIIEICEDGYKGYATAADNLQNSDLTTLFGRLSQQRKLFAEELRNDVREYGIELNESGSVKGFFHRTWLSAKAVFSFDVDDSVINSSLTGEKEAKDVYTETITMDMPAALRERLTNQLNLIKGAINQLHELETLVS